MISYEVLTSEKITSYLHFTSYKSGLPIIVNEKSNSYLFLGANEMDKPIGLMLCKLDNDNKTASILSANVDEGYRQKGVATNMLKSMVSTLKQRGFNKIQITYFQNNSNYPYFEKILKKSGWLNPVPRMVVCRIECAKLMKAPWITKYQLPPDYSLFLWSNITPSEKEEVLSLEEKKGWYPKNFNPFLSESIMAEKISLGLKFKDKIIGWMIVTYYSENTINYPKLYICEKYQDSGKAIVMLAEAIKLQYKHKITYGLFAFDIDNIKMRLFFEKRLKPYM
ncbi:MAG: GNAT family N-acetyltransferase, partial [Spirochaetaceae bacterium]|nr:GNAT family N-acetyltransferase [Spirochaetaceae bacterium]